jgi:cell division protein FtsW (lipid II flippase)
MSIFDRGTFITGVKKLSNIDWILFSALLPILGAGLITMKSFVGDSNFFGKQLIWISISLAIFFAFSLIDFRFLRRTEILVGIFLFFCFLLIILFVVGHISPG